MSSPFMEKEGSKVKQGEGRENEWLGALTPLEGRGMLDLHLNRASWGVRDISWSSHRQPWWHLKTGYSLWAISSVVPAAIPTPAPNCGKLHVKWNVALTSAGAFHRNKADNGDSILYQRRREGDTSLRTAFSILMTNQHGHSRISVTDAMLSFLSHRQMSRILWSEYFVFHLCHKRKCLSTLTYKIGP